MLIEEIPHQGLSAFIADLARQHGVTYERTPSSALAQAFTRLSGDEGAPDSTERLIIALGRAKVVDDRTLVTLQSRYLHEKFQVRPVR